MIRLVTLIPELSYEARCIWSYRLQFLFNLHCSRTGETSAVILVPFIVLFSWIPLVSNKPYHGCDKVRCMKSGKWLCFQARLQLNVIIVRVLTVSVRLTACENSSMADSIFIRSDPETFLLKFDDFG